MMIYFILFLIFILLLSVELGYFSLAKKLQIVDKPNARSSHSISTIRGGGIIFPIACLGLVPFVSFPYQWNFFFGLLIISIVSLADDVKSISSIKRSVVQLASLCVILFPFIEQVGIIGMVFSLFLMTGIVNGYNFMDGINGITALYSTVTIGTLFWISRSIVSIIPDLFFVSLLAALVIFSFFNLRRRARCFAGDVGSVSMAFIICFLLFILYIKTGFISWLLLLGIYGIDTFATILCRIFRKEPIFRAHRSHFYQFLTNEAGISHIVVSVLFAGVQLVLNVVVILFYRKGQNLLAWLSLFVVLLIYTIFRLRFEGRYRLFTAYNR